MSAKAYHRARYVRPVLIMGKARMRAMMEKVRRRKDTQDTQFSKFF